MKLWRISPYADLSGEGGRLFDGRWNGGGRAIVYTAESSALALLEVLIRFGRREIPAPYQLLEIEAPDELVVESYARAAPSESVASSVAWGETWLRTGRTALARVPSAVAPQAYNYLLNPAHPEAAKVRILSHARYEWDVRLFD